MVKPLKEALWHSSQLVLNAGGDAVWKYFHEGMGSILMFHRVRPEPDRPRLGKYTRTLEITPEILEDIVVALGKQGYRIVSLETLIEVLQERRKEKRLAVLTFDDGYVDVYHHVHPIAEKYQVPYCVYVTTCFPDRTAQFWWYQLEDLLLANSVVTANLNGEKTTWKTDSQEEKSRAYAEIASVLVRSMPRQAESLMNESYRNVEMQRNPYGEEGLSWEQLRELSTSPLVTIGGHKSSHVGLGYLSAEDGRNQIMENKQRLEAECNVSLRHFCYPFGTSSVAGQRECDLVRECGYVSATTTNNGNVFPEHRNHLLCLPRISVPAGCDYAGPDSLMRRMDGRTLCRQHPFKRVVTSDAYNQGLSERRP